MCFQPNFNYTRKQNCHVENLCWQMSSPKKQAKNKPKWLVSEVTGHPSVKKTKLLLEWPPTIELEMRKTPNYLQLTCVAWTNGHRDDGTCAESGRALGLLPTFSYWLFYSIIWFWSFQMIVDKFWHTSLFELNMNRQRKWNFLSLNCAQSGTFK